VLPLLSPPDRVAATILAATPQTRAAALVSLEEAQAAGLVVSLPSDRRGDVLLELANGASAVLRRREEAERGRAEFREKWNNPELLHPLQRSAWSGLEADGAELWPGAMHPFSLHTAKPQPAAGERAIDILSAMTTQQYSQRWNF
jgi:hypothetical protein